MGLFDSLFERKRNREMLQELQQMKGNRDAAIGAGHYSERDGLTACLHCGYKLSQEDIEDNRRRCSDLPKGIDPKDMYECPACRRILNY